MVNSHFSLLDVAINSSTTSNSKHRVGAVIDGPYGYSMAVNDATKGHPKLKSLGYPPHANQHAEFRLIEKYTVRGSAKGSTVYIARTSVKGVIKTAFPCPACEALLKKAGVKRIIYTTFTGAESKRL